MSTKQISALIAQEAQRPLSTNKDSSALTTASDAPLTELQLTSQGLFDESKALWEEFVAFDKEHQITQRIGAQLWRLTKAIGKPALVLSIKGIQTAVVTVADADKRTALIERFRRSKTAQAADAALEATKD